MRSRRGRRLVFESLEQRQLLATITVTSLADNLNVDNQVTLREAIRAAEFDISVDGSATGSGADTIQFAGVLAGDIDLLLVGDTAVGSSALVVTTAVTIRGNTAGITVQRSEIGPQMRLIRVASSGDLTLENMTFAGGLLRALDGILPDGSGGDARVAPSSIRERFESIPVHSLVMKPMVATASAAVTAAAPAAAPYITTAEWRRSSMLRYPEIKPKVELVLKRRRASEVESSVAMERCESTTVRLLAIHPLPIEACLL